MSAQPTLTIKECKLKDINGTYKKTGPARYIKSRCTLFKRNNIWIVNDGNEDVCWSTGPSLSPESCRWSYKTSATFRIMGSGMRVEKVRESSTTNRNRASLPGTSAATEQDLPPPPPLNETEPAPQAGEVETRPVSKKKAPVPSLTPCTNTGKAESSNSRFTGNSSDIYKQNVEITLQNAQLKKENRALKAERDKAVTEATAATATSAAQIHSLTFENGALKRQLEAALNQSREAKHPIAIALVRVREELAKAEQTIAQLQKEKGELKDRVSVMEAELLKKKEGSAGMEEQLNALLQNSECLRELAGQS